MTDMPPLPDERAAIDEAVQALGGWKKADGVYQIGTSSISIGSEGNFVGPFGDAILEAAGMLAPDNPMAILLASPDCDEGTLREAIRGADRDLAMVAMRHQNAPQEDIAEILQADGALEWPLNIRGDIYSAVLDNPNASSEVLDAAWAICLDPRYAWQVAIHPNVSNKLFRHLATVAPTEDLSGIALNRGALAALDNEDLPEIEAARAIFDLRICVHTRAKMIQHPSFTPAGTCTLISDLQKWDREGGGDGGSVEMRQCIARWEASPGEVTHLLEQDHDESVRLALLDNPKTSSDLALMWKLRTRPSRVVSTFLDGWLEGLSKENRALVDAISEDIGLLEAIPPLDRLGDDPPEISGLGDLM